MEKQTVLFFLGKAWLLWWAAALLMVLRWHHVLVAGSQPDGVDDLAQEVGGLRPAMGHPYHIARGHLS